MKLAMSRETFNHIAQDTKFGDLRSGTFYFNGIPIVISDNPLLRVPKLQVSGSVPMTAECRTSINKWLLDTFGCHHTILSLPDTRSFTLSEAYVPYDPR